MDIITGFELIDFDKRMYVFEGLSDGAMTKIKNFFHYEHPNDDNCKILKNQNVLFQERLYLDFNVRIKMIKLRETLEEIVNNPDMYSRIKVPENIY